MLQSISATALLLTQLVSATQVPLAQSLAQMDTERGWGGYTPPHPTSIDLIANLRYDEIYSSSNLDDDTTAPDVRNIIIGSTTNGGIEGNAGAWIAAHDTIDEFLLVTLRRTEMITGIITQGQPDETGAIISHVSKYCVLIHDDEGWKTTYDEGEMWEEWDPT